MGRFLCNTLQEARTARPEPWPDSRGFDVIVIGGGTFGSVVAEHCSSPTGRTAGGSSCSRPGRSSCPSTCRTCPSWAARPIMRVPWVNHPALNYPGSSCHRRAVAHLGRLVARTARRRNDRLAAAGARPRLRARNTSSRRGRQIGVKETNDFIYGPLHTALRKQLHAGLKAAGQRDGSPSATCSIILRCAIPIPGSRPRRRAASRLARPAADRHDAATPSCANSSSSKRRWRCSPRQCPGSSRPTSSAPCRGLIRAARLAANEADGTGPAADARKRLMIVPNCHVQELITETSRTTGCGSRACASGTTAGRWTSRSPRRATARQSAVVIALGTVETTRLALTTFQQSLAGRAAQRMGRT